MNRCFRFKSYIIMIHLHLHGGNYNEQETQKFRSSHPEAFLGKGVLKIGSKFNSTASKKSTCMYHRPLVVWGMSKTK